MRRVFIPLTVVLCFLIAPYASAVLLQDAYNSALPGAGYDKLVYLDPAETYYGGLTISNASVCILSHGATVLLAGSRIIVESNATLDICGVVLTYSDSAAIKFNGAATGWIDHCSFFNNYDAVYFWTGANVKLTSNIFSYSNHYGVFTCQGTERFLAYNDAWQNAMGDYREWCPG
ncbi:MAG: right-handed parallel beta-helix repeat-containing protein [bacterium]